MTGFDGARLEDTTETTASLPSLYIVHTITLHVLHVLFLTLVDPFSARVFAVLVFLCFSLGTYGQPLFTNSAPSVEVPFPFLSPSSFV